MATGIDVRRFHMPTKVLFGEGSSQVVGQEASALSASRPMVVVDPGVAQAGLHENALASLQSAGLRPSVFADVVSNPRLNSAIHALKVFKAESCDFLVAIGGGSAIDTAKAVSVLSTNEGSPVDFEGWDRFKNTPMPLVAIPTTAGTGSEVTFYCTLIDPARRVKFGIISPRLAARVALLDPLLLKTCPRWLIAGAGMDAFCHAVEGYLSLGATLFNQALALQAVRLISGNIRAAYADSTNLDAIGNMLIGSTLAGGAVANAGAIMPHAMAFAIGGSYDVHHGVVCGILLAHGLEFNRWTVPERILQVGLAMGLDLRQSDPDEGAGRTIEAVRMMTANLSLPPSLESIGVKGEDIPRLARLTLEVPAFKLNPRRATLGEVEALFEVARSS